MNKASLKTWRRGYTLLFAVIIATVVLGVAVFIVDIGSKQYMLASTARESTYAIYAADSGVECASAIRNSFSSTSQPTIACDSTSVNASRSTNVPLPTGWDTNTEQSWTYDAIKLSGDECVVLTLTAAMNDNVTPPAPAMFLDSRGYNVCKMIGGVLGPDTTSSKTVERALRITYSGVW